MTKKICFERFEETRWQAFMHVDKACLEMGITQRTYYRWKAEKKAPVWAYNLMKRCTGDLEIFGWKNWKIENGVLYNNGLHHVYHNWKPQDLIKPLFKPDVRNRDTTQPPILKLINGGKVNGVNRKEQTKKKIIDKTQ